MRPSKKAHVLAIVRLVIGYHQKHMATILGCSDETVQSVETGRLKMSDSMAQRIHHETGVAIEWLLAGDVSVPPYAWQMSAKFQGFVKVPYTKDIFDAQQSENRRPKGDMRDLWQAGLTVKREWSRIAAMALDAFKKDRIALFAHRLGESLASLEREFPMDVEFWKASLANIYGDDGSTVENYGPVAKQFQHLVDSEFLKKLEHDPELKKKYDSLPNHMKIDQRIKNNKPKRRSAK